MEQVTRNMKKLRLLPQSWSSARAEGPLSPPALSPPPPPAHTLRPPSSHKRGLSLRNLSESSDEDDVVQVLGARDRPPPPSRTSLPRMKHLRDFLCSIETTPVRTVRAGEKSLDGYCVCVCVCECVCVCVCACVCVCVCVCEGLNV